MKFKIILIFLHFSIFGISQEISDSSFAIQLDSVLTASESYDADSLLQEYPSTNNIVYPKHFDQKLNSRYRSADFDYTTIKPQESLWQKLQKKIVKILESIFGPVDPNKTTAYAENILRFFSIVIIGLVLYILIKFFLSKDGNFFFGKKNKKINIENQDLHENIHEINFNESIRDFERKKEYRSAIRYHFLFVLKKLADQKKINWNPEKTNKDYLHELKTDQLKVSFKELSYIFDYVWYGDFKVTEERYSNFKVKFSEFKL